MIYVFSGALDSGKTTKMEKYYSILQDSKKGDGILSKKVFEDGQCIGYDFCQCSSDISIAGLRLKHRLPEHWDEAWEIGKYSFSLRGYNFASSVLRQCIVNNGPAMWIDEIGRLELDGNGFSILLASALKQDFSIYISCRIDFLQRVINKFSIDNYQVIAC